MNRTESRVLTDLRGRNVYLSARWRPASQPLDPVAELAAVRHELRRRGAQVSSWWHALAELEGDWLAAIEADAEALAAAHSIIVVGDADDPGVWEIAQFMALPIARFETCRSVLPEPLMSLCGSPDRVSGVGPDGRLRRWRDRCRSCWRRSVDAGRRCWDACSQSCSRMPALARRNMTHRQALPVGGDNCGRRSPEDQPRWAVFKNRL